jgi:hypothetical protein
VPVPPQPDPFDFFSDPPVEYPNLWAARIVCADLDCRSRTDPILRDLRRAMAEDLPCRATPAQALLLFHSAIELAVRAGSLHAHLSSKSCCSPCDARVARFLSTHQSTALPRDPSVRSDGAPLSS